MAGGREETNFYAVFQPSAFSQGARSFVTKQYVQGPMPQGPSGYPARNGSDYGFFAQTVGYAANAATRSGAFDASNAMEEAAQKAVEYAAKNTSPISYSDALRIVPPHANFWLAPMYNVHAYFVAAYWLAVGALMTGDAALRQLSQDALSSGENRNYILIQEASGDVETILDNAINHLARTPQTKAPYEALKRLRDPNFRASQEALLAETSAAGMASGAAAGSAEDAARAVEIGRGVFTGEKPSGMSDWEWFFTRYKWTIIGVGVGTVALIAVGRPYAMAYYETVRARREEKARRGGSGARSRSRSRGDDYDYDDEG